ncbi:right-handed parallel beta-helix repeat-containing protein, partial [bacterium]|nr:right-handed parallel beta-helix repeat-containing protein [bacterium]
MRAEVISSMVRFPNIIRVFGMKSSIHPGLVALVLAIAFLSLSASPLWATDHSGTIYNDTTWYAADNPHVIVDHVIVLHTLTLEDGVEVQFNSGKQIAVSGTLIAIGTPGTGILFTRSGASNGYRLLFQYGGKGTLDYCTIEYLTYGIYTYSGADTISVSNCTIQNNNCAVCAEAGTVELSSNTLANNYWGFFGDEVAPTLLDVNNVFENNSIGIQIMDVSGVNLNTAATVRNNTNAGIYLRNCTANATLDNLTLQGNGGTWGAIYMESCGEFTIGSGNTIGGSGQENSWPLTMNTASYPSLASSGNIPASGNTNNGIQVDGGSTAANITWRFLGVDYIVTDDPIISWGGTLDIEDGVTVRFDLGGDALRVSGTLNAPGSAGILFTRYQGGDQWRGLRFYAGSSGTLQHCTIEYATCGHGYGIYASGTFPTIEHCTIRNNGYGIYATNATLPTLSVSNTIQDNNIAGVCFHNCTNPSVSNQTITGNSGTYGALYMRHTGEFTIGAGNTIGGVGLENSWPLTISMGSYPSAASSGNIPTSGNTNDDIQVYGGGSSANTG